MVLGRYSPGVERRESLGVCVQGSVPDTSCERGAGFESAGLAAGGWAAANDGLTFLVGWSVLLTLASETPKHAGDPGPSILMLSGKFRHVAPELPWD